MRGKRDKSGPFWFPSLCNCTCKHQLRPWNNFFFKLEQLALPLPQSIYASHVSLSLGLHGIVFLNTYTDWKCELREGVLNIIKLGYKGTVTALQSADSAILFPTTLMEPVNWCENVPFPILPYNIYDCTCTAHYHSKLNQS